MQHRDNLAERIDRHPEPHYLRPAPQPCADFIQLHVGQVEVLEDALVERHAVGTSAGQPSRNRGVLMPEHPHCSGDREPFGQCREHLANALGGGFEPVKRGHPEGTRAER